MSCCLAGGLLLLALIVFSLVFGRTPLGLYLFRRIPRMAFAALPGQPNLFVALTITLSLGFRLEFVTIRAAFTGNIMRMFEFIGRQR